MALCEFYQLTQNSPHTSTSPQSHPYSWVLHLNDIGYILQLFLHMSCVNVAEWSKCLSLSLQHCLHESASLQNGGEVQSSVAETAPALPCHPAPLLFQQQSTETTSLLSCPPLHISLQAPHASSQIPVRRPRLSTAPVLLGGPSCCQTAETEVHLAGLSSWRRIYSKKGMLK